MSVPSWSRPAEHDPWWARYAFYVTSAWGPWLRWALGVVVVALLIAAVAGGCVAGLLVGLGYLEPRLFRPSPAAGGLGAGVVAAGVVAATRVGLRRRRRHGARSASRSGP